jgi:hypothetical protein
MTTYPDRGPIIAQPLTALKKELGENLVPQNLQIAADRADRRTPGASGGRGPLGSALATGSTVAHRDGGGD